MPNNSGYWICRRRGVEFVISPSSGCFALICDDEILDSYASPEIALEELVTGRFTWPSAGDPSSFGLPADLSEWAFLKVR